MKLWYSSIIVRTLGVGTIITIVVSVFSRSVAAGLIMGLLFGAIHQKAQESFFTAMLGLKSFNRFFFGVYFLGNFGMIAMPLLIGSMYPDFVNVFGAAFGLLLYKIMIYAEGLFVKRKER